MTATEEFDRSIAFAEAALAHLRRNRLPAHPRNYDLWFAYAAGLNPALNAAIDRHVAEHGCLSDEAALTLYAEHVSPSRLGARLKQVGGNLAGEASGIERLLGVALSAADGFGSALKAAADELRQSAGTEAVGHAMEKLAESTQTVEAQSQSLRRQLADARLEMVALHRNLEAIQHESLTDQLTGLANRKYFDRALQLALADPTSAPVALILADVDHFKSFNDRFGHQTGDQVLHLVAQTMKRTLKGQDTACRYGGEEFAVILPTTQLPNALVVAEHIRDAVADRALIRRSTGESLGRVTVSLGVAAYRPGDSVQSMVERADAALYQSKLGGRNQTTAQLRDRSPVARAG